MLWYICKKNERRNIMKKIKLFSLVAIILGGLFLLSGCGQKELTGSLEDIMNDLNEYTFKGYADDEKPFLANINVLQDAPYKLYVLWL